ncbi:MAG: YidC/Oxa1 family membrane protein insertase [Clostridia bacterium]|nr:YidC/Oxa1 family membrane protein insertase [Clostridia bacterium]
MIKILNFFANILSFIIYPIYGFVKNYGLAVILFTIIVKIILFPLGIKQQKTTVKTKKIRPELERIQAKYKNDKEKLNEETMKLYQKYNINPMGGCLPLLIQLPILLGLYRIIQSPITWFFRKTPAVYINDMINSGEMAKAEVIEKLEKVASIDNVDISSFTEINDILGAMAKGVKNFEIEIASEFNLINFDLLGIDLSRTPDIKNFSILWIIPVLATGSAFFSNWVSKKLNSMSEEQAQQMKTMNLIMPLMTAVFTFTLSAGIGLYWFVSTMLSVLQMVILTKYFDKKYANMDFGINDKKGKGKNK